MYKFGKVSIIGRPNAGKSTLLNKLIGEKISIVSPKAQTTRDIIQGVLTTEEYQIVFVDTPGINKGNSPLSKYMARGVKTASSDVDVILYCIDGEKGMTASNKKDVLDYASQGIPLIVAFTKLDRADKGKLVGMVGELSQIKNISAIIPISTFRNKNIEELLTEIVKLLPEGEKAYFDDYLTDKPMRFIAAERIREKILYLYNDEIPHGVAVEIQKYEYDENRDVCDIVADIICEKQAHKGILIGKKGLALKETGRKAREDLERFLGCRVYLELFVKVKENWRESEYLTREFGFDPKNLSE